MQFTAPLIEGTFLRRYKRFFADAKVKNEELTAHCVNTGAMAGVLDVGNRVWLSPADNPKRKLKYTWEIVEAEGALIGINTNRTNRIAEEAILAGCVPELADYTTLRREVRYGTNSRIDLLLEHADRPACYVEVKNVHLKNGKFAEFPDAVTSRGTKHMAELGLLAQQGTRAVVLFVVQRDDCAAFRPAHHIDPVYAAALHEAQRNGVEAYCYSCYVAPDEIRINRALPVHLEQEAGQDEPCR